MPAPRQEQKTAALNVKRKAHQAVEAQLEILCRHVDRETEEDLSQGILCPGRDSNQRAPEYNAESLMFEPMFGRRLAYLDTTVPERLQVMWRWEINSYKILVWKYEQKRRSRKWKNTTKMDLAKTQCEGEKWIQVAANEVACCVRCARGIDSL
jgi:hypothetical protein